MVDPANRVNGSVQGFPVIIDNLPVASLDVRTLLLTLVVILRPRGAD
jgi:hypothetical protein